MKMEKSIKVCVALLALVITCAPVWALDYADAYSDNFDSYTTTDDLWAAGWRWGAAPAGVSTTPAPNGTVGLEMLTSPDGTNANDPNFAMEKSLSSTAKWGTVSFDFYDAMGVDNAEMYVLTDAGPWNFGICQWAGSLDQVNHPEANGLANFAIRAYNYTGSGYYALPDAVRTEGWRAVDMVFSETGVRYYLDGQKVFDSTEVPAMAGVTPGIKTLGIGDGQGSYVEGEWNAHYIDNLSVTPEILPEPASMLLLASGAIAVVVRRRK